MDWLIRPWWMADALCKEYGQLEFVPPPKATPSALEPLRAVCRCCGVRGECLDYALDDESLVGVWGGTTAQERRDYRKAAKERDRQALAATPPWKRDELCPRHVRESPRNTR